MTSPASHPSRATTIAAAHPTKWRWLAFAMLSSGGAAVELALATPTIHSSHDWVGHVVAFTFVVMGALVAIFARAAERHMLLVSSLIITITTVQIAMLVAVAKGIPGLPFFFLWPLLSASYMYSRRAFYATVAFAAAAYGIALLPVFQGVPFAGVNFVVTSFAALMVLVGSRLLNEIANQMFIKLKTVAEFDPLTGLRNRRSFYAEAELLLSTAAAKRTSLAMLAIDLDHFKAINDTFGHSAGDDALRTTGALLDRLFPTPQLAARIGGEEFVVVLPGTSLDGALELAVAFRDAIRASDALPDAVLTASVGVAMLRPGQTLEALLADADDAAYQAKSEGRDTISVNHGDGPGRLRLPPLPRSPSAVTARPIP
jgi:diguanylate cyclase (GGDEF)-like protein